MKIPDKLKWKATGTDLGRGGQAPVVEVLDTTSNDGESYALKALSKGKPRQAYERFAREIEAIKRLDHPGIIKIFDHSEADSDFHYYVMEYIPGARSLKKLLGTGENPFHKNVKKSLNLFIQIADAIDACEDEGIVHRDLSPANILILPDESIKIIDFGVCQMDDDPPLTRIDEAVGTPNYMAPECESGAGGPIGPWSDLYSAGKILWSAITNQNAFSREAPVFREKSMASLLKEIPEAGHLHHVFAKTIRHKNSDRWNNAESALYACRRVSFLIRSGYPTLDEIESHCPICGVGRLDYSTDNRLVFGNLNSSGTVSKCSYCGYCFGVDLEQMNRTLKEQSNLS